MADPRYIGARYVPRFMGTYDPTQVYEGLDVVDNEDEFLYISKRPVPRNTPPTNRNYWAVYGHIQNVQDQIDAINDEIEEMQDGSVAGSLQNQINANDNEIADMKDGTVTGSLQNQINANNNEIADMKNGTVTGSLQNQINAISNKIGTFELHSFTVTRQTSKTITLSNSSGALLFANGPVRDLMGLYSITVISDGSTECQKISTSDNIAGESITTSTGTRTVTINNNNTGNGLTCYLILFRGSIISI